MNRDEKRRKGGDGTLQKKSRDETKKGGSVSKNNDAGKYKNARYSVNMSITMKKERCCRKGDAVKEQKCKEKKYYIRADDE